MTSALAFGMRDAVADLSWCVRSAVGAESWPLWAMWRPVAPHGAATPRGRGPIREGHYQPPLYFRSGKLIKKKFRAGLIKSVFLLHSFLILQMNYNFYSILFRFIFVMGILLR